MAGAPEPVRLPSQSSTEYIRAAMVDTSPPQSAPQLSMASHCALGMPSNRRPATELMPWFVRASLWSM